MPSKDPAQRFEDILENGKRIRLYTVEITQAEFVGDAKTIDAVERCLERIAEAVRKLGNEFDAKYPNLDLQKQLMQMIIEIFALRLERETYLHSALDNIEWAHNGVGDTAGEDTSHHAFFVVTKIVNVSHDNWFMFFLN